jgi:hypothetical protein
MRRARCAGTLIVIVCALVVYSPEVSASSSTPVHLDGGPVSKFKWDVLASEGGSRKRPCLKIVLERLRHRSPVEIQLGEVSCRPVQPLPNLLGVVDELDHPNVTVIAMAFPRAARSVSLFFAGKKKDRTMHLRLLSRYKAAKARLVPFRYGAIAFKGQSCLSRFVTHAKDGTVLDDGGAMHCQG